MIRKVDQLISLPATDVPRAVRFYTEVLGCKTMVEHPDTGFYIFGLPEGQGWLGIHRHTSPMPVPDPDGVWVWVWVDDLEAAADRLRAAGVRILGKPREMGPGRELPFSDSEGNVLRLYQPLDRVERSVVVEAPIEAVFRAVTTAATIERWFSTIDNVVFDGRDGGQVSFIDPAFGPVVGRITLWQPPRRVVVEFSQNWPRRLEYALQSDGAHTRLQVWQNDFAPLRDRDFGIPGMIEHLDQALLLLATLAKTGAIALSAVDFVKAVRELKKE